MSLRYTTAQNVVQSIYPQKDNIRVIHAVKNFAAISGVCHIGLGVTATNNCKVLRRQGIHTEAWATQTYKELADRLRSDKPRTTQGYLPVSHVIVSAPSWVQPAEFKALTLEHPNIEFVLLNHSGCAYLSIDKNGIRNIKECVSLEREVHNFRVAANNKRVNDWLIAGLRARGLLLTNLYDTTAFVKNYPRRRTIQTLRIGSFGAGRPWKNQLTASEGAVQLARQLGTNLELYVNSKRPDGGERMIESRNELFAHERDLKLVEVPWESWPRFAATCGHMHLLLQPSFDETFNVVTADGIAAGVASVTSSSIEWTPRDWWCETEDPASIVKVGLQLLHNEFAVEEGRKCLTDYVNGGIGLWINYLMGMD